MKKLKQNTPKIFFTKRAEKDLLKLSLVDRQKVIAKIKHLSLPLQRSNLNIKTLVGVKGFYRLRIGNIRVIFEVDNNRYEIWIRLIGYRSHIYRHL